ncbi:uncharacterized protein LOC142523783 [Primulina tabacum]|uniref:uncharacterized protein LOC142523783 n=1 Tax=Primulina tabacum TaxID=48773 RepID=UPI003F59B9B1
MASSLIGEGDREVIHHTKLVSTIVTSPITSQESSWKTPLLEFISKGQLPGDVQQAQNIKRHRSRLSILNGELYRRSFHGPLLKCLSGEETKYVLKEIHEGCCGDHLGATTLTHKALLSRFWWHTMNTDAREVVRSCEGFQHHGNFCHIPASPLQPVRASCPFDQ